MATAAELLLPLRPGLVPVPAAGQPGVCGICHSGCDRSYGQCYPCLEAVQVFGVGDVLPISMSVDGGLLHRHLRGYKDDRSPQVRTRMSLRLAALVAIFFHNHARCVGDFDSLVLVPSSSRTAVEGIIQLLPLLRDQYRPALRVTGMGSKSDLRPDRFGLTRRVEGETVLLLDDTFTRGPSIFSALAALREAGAVVVGPMVIGRHVQPGWAPSSDLLDWLQKRSWDEERCCRCDGEHVNPGQML